MVVNVKILPLSILTCILMVGLTSAESEDIFNLKFDYKMSGGITNVFLSDLSDSEGKEIIVGSSQQTLVGGAGWVSVLDKDGKQIWQYSLPGSILCMDVADLDFDGKDSIIACVFSSVHVIEPDRSNWDISTRYSYRIGAIHVNDIDDDNFREIIVGSGSGSMNNELFIINKNKKFSWRKRINGQANAIYSADINNDNQREIMVGTVGRQRLLDYSATVTVYNSTGNKLFSYSTENGVTYITSTDINEDGKEEILIGCKDFLYVIDDNGTELWKYVTAGTIRKILVEDIDNNGKLEIILGSNDVYVLDTNGELIWKNNVGAEVYDLQTVDIDKDGLKELLIGSETAYLLDSNGDTIWNYKTENIVKSVVAGDIESDGYIDIVLGTGGGNIYVFQSETYTKKQTATEYYNTAKDLYNKKQLENATEYAERAKEIYTELDDDEGIRNVENLIEQIGRYDLQINQLRLEADSYYNKSFNAYISSDYVNASSYANKAKYKYISLKDYEKIEKCNEIINNSEYFLRIESDIYLKNATDLYNS
ncbi:MAG TPA: hypothetical protein EYP86_01280, partial [Candidatus Altiarchaeales archaeon]|nr:hypothetical protein [Candidatus Altiarchaeales archaeon]